MKGGEKKTYTAGGEGKKINTWEIKIIKKKKKFSFA